MEHPLINNLDNLTLDQLQEKINDLTKKMSIAHRMGNHGLRAQIEMALASYRTKLQEKQDELWKKQTKSGQDFSNKINIS